MKLNFYNCSNFDVSSLKPTFRSQISVPLLIFFEKNFQLLFLLAKICRFVWICMNFCHHQAYILNIRVKFGARDFCFETFTALKVSVFGVFLVHFFSHLDRKRELRSISLYSVQMRESMDQKNSEYVHFSRSGFFFLMYTLLNIILWEYTCTGKILVNICHLNQNAQKRPPLLLQARSATLLKKRLWHRCFSVNFAKFLRTLFLQNTSGRLLL